MVAGSPSALIPDSQSEIAAQSGAGEQSRKTRMQRAMAELASIVAHDIDADETIDGKWPMGWTIAFAVAVSLGLWALLAGVLYLV